MNETQGLLALGLTPPEAKVYLALVEHGRRGAASLAELAGVPRSSVYSVLDTLVEKGLVVGGSGYGARFRALPPSEGLWGLVEAARIEMADRERVARELTETLSSLAHPQSEVADVVEVLRHPRVITERLEKLEREATQDMATLVKAPIITTWAQTPSETRVPRPDVRDRVIYEVSVLEDPRAASSLRVGLEAGEQARIFRGELPTKLALFDSRVSVVPLVEPGEPSAQTTALIVRNPALNRALLLLFETLWQSSEELPRD